MLNGAQWKPVFKNSTIKTKVIESVIRGLYEFRQTSNRIFFFSCILQTPLGISPLFCAIENTK